MSDTDEHHFESKADAGASKTYPQQAGTIRKNGHLVIKGRPCKVVEVSTSKTGKHGHAKCHFVAIDIFTAKKLEDIVPSSHNCDVPHVDRTDYQLIDISEDGFVGKDVILYALFRSEQPQPVAKGTIVSTIPDTIVGGQPLGKEFCEVIVTCIFKRDEALPRPYADVETMGGAKNMTITWPYEKIKVANKTKATYKMKVTNKASTTLTSARR